MIFEPHAASIAGHYHSYLLQETGICRCMSFGIYFRDFLIETYVLLVIWSTLVNVLLNSGGKIWLVTIVKIYCLMMVVKRDCFKAVYT